MRFARLLLAGLLSLGVAIQGFAASRAMEADCPMLHAGSPQHAAPPVEAHDMHGAHDMDHGMADAPAEPPCHGDAPAPAKGDPGHCGCVVGCQPAGSLPLIAAVLPAIEPIVRAPPPPVAARFHSHTSLRHWRPPASI